ncbi:cupin domain-containing protein [Glaciibacter sp. 2TAF33]|uniref:cupin domain-containing protein n=1 Tax=Glaciibacter sp. 2TAF33 TaxID=3233015 RepID=UPI003F8FC799
MADNVVTSLEVKSNDSPDETRTPDKTRVTVNKLGSYTVGRFTFEPGWSWSDCIKPVVQTESCQVNHVGYCVSGTLEVETIDGATATITAGDSFAIPPGHNAHVVGSEPYVGIEFVGAATYAT